MPASPEYLAALQAAMQPQPGVIDMPVQTGLEDEPSPPMVPGQVDPTQGRDADVLSRLEASDVHNTEVMNARAQGRVNGIGDVIPENGPAPSPFAAPAAGSPLFNDLSAVHTNVPDAPAAPAESEPAARFGSSGAVFFSPRPAEAAKTPAPAAAATGGGGNPYAGVLKTLTAPLDEQKAAQGELSQAEQRVEEDKAVAAGLRGQAMGAQAEDIQAKAAERDAKLQEQLDKIQALSSDVASMKIDPDRFWKTKSTGQKISYGIAAALGGFVSGYRGGPNQALEQMNGEISRDIDAQKAEIEQKRGQVGDMKGILAETYKRFGNMEQAEQAARLASLQQLDQQAQQYAVGSNSDIIQARGKMLSAGIDEQKAQLQAHLMQAAAATSAANTKELRMEIAKRVQDLRDKAATNGVDLSPGEARRQAMHEIMGQDPGTGSEKGYAKGDTSASSVDAIGQQLKSTAWQPQRNMQGTEAFKNEQIQKQWNAEVMAVAHKRGAKNPDQQRDIFDAYIIRPGDTQKTIEQKRDAFEKNIVKKGGASAAASPPPGFKSIDDEEDGK